MVKTLDVDSTYEPSKRTFKWLKMKKDYLDDGMVDTFDLVVIAAQHGIGKRTGKYGTFLLACYNPEWERYETCCKTGTGFTDEMLKKVHEQLQDIIIPEPLKEYELGKALLFKKMDVWFQPKYVWEIKGADLQLSPVHTAGLGHEHQSKGIGIRFPRMQRIRTDKGPTDATTHLQVNILLHNVIVA